MTKARFILYPFLMIGLLLSSCSETKEDVGVFHNWQERSIQFVDSLAMAYDEQKQNPEVDHGLKAILGTSENNSGRAIEVYYKKYGNFYTDENSIWAKEDFPEGIEARLDKKPYETSKVRVFYRGMLFTKEELLHKLPKPYFITSGYKNFVNFDANFATKPNEDHPDPLISIDLDLTTKEPNNSQIMIPGSTVPGFSAMLQEMSPGDRVEVYIPYKYAYGKNSSGPIPGYSTLIFDLTLVDIIEQ